MDKYTIVIIVTIVGFAILASILLVPVYRFLKKEEKISEEWTQEALKERAASKAEPKEEDSE